MSNSIRLLQSLQKSPYVPASVLVRHAGGGGKQPIGGSSLQFPPGPRQMEQLKNWIPAASVFGAVGFSLICYFTDWKVTNAYIPFYGGKFSDED